MSMITVHTIHLTQALHALIGDHVMHWLHDEDHGIIAGPVCECGWAADEADTPDVVRYLAQRHITHVLTATVAAGQTGSETAP
jgi:hypothetical protein